MKVDQATIERLAFIKHLHRQAEERSRLPQPHSSTAILGFHDSVELFLALASEEVGGENKYQFMEYWDEIRRKSETELTQKAAMERLNEARVNLKHYGNRPNKKDIESYRATVRSFLEENTERIFGIEYSKVSLVDLIQFDDARERAESAEMRMDGNNFGESVCQISSAFDVMFEEFDDRVRDQLGYTPYPTPDHKNISSDMIFGYGIDSELFADVGKAKDPREVDTVREETAIMFYKMNNTIGDILENLYSVYDALRINSLGIDQPRYQRFISIIPEVNRNGQPKFPYWSGENVTEEEARFCLDFLVEVALRLQEVPLDFDEEPSTPQTLDEF